MGPESAGMAYLGGMIVPGVPSEGLPGHKIRDVFCLYGRNLHDAYLTLSLAVFYRRKLFNSSCILLRLPTLPQKNLIQCILGCSLGVFFRRIASFRALYRRKLYRRSGACGAEENATGAYLSSSQFLFQVSLFLKLSPNRASRVIWALSSNRGIGKWRKKLIEKSCKIVGDSVETFQYVLLACWQHSSVFYAAWIWSSCLFASLAFLRRF